MEHLKGSTESSRKLDLTNNPKAVKSFEDLKQLLISPQLLAYPDFNSHEKFIMDTDYSNSGIGVMLSQVQNGSEKPIANNARKAQIQRKPIWFLQRRIASTHIWHQFVQIFPHWKTVFSTD